jgi:hypothetical protein
MCFCLLTWSTFLPNDSLPHILTMPVPCLTLHGYSQVCLTSVTKTQGGQGYISEFAVILSNTVLVCTENLSG